MGVSEALQEVLEEFYEVSKVFRRALRELTGRGIARRFNTFKGVTMRSKSIKGSFRELHTLSGELYGGFRGATGEWG